MRRFAENPRISQRPPCFSSHCKGPTAFPVQGASQAIRGPIDGIDLSKMEKRSTLLVRHAIPEAGRRLASGEEEVVAFGVVREPIEPGELVALCRTRLTAGKTPHTVRFESEIPKSSIGNIDKRALAERLDL